MFDGDSDYIVEQYIKPKRIAVPLINDERADILGNFDDNDDKHVKKKGKKKTKEIERVSEENPFADDDDDDDDEVDDEDMKEDSGSEIKEKNGHESGTESEKEAQSDAEVDSDEVMETTNDDAPVEAASDDEPVEPVESKMPKKKEPKTKKKKVKPAETMEPSTSKKTELNDDQIKALIRGASKQDRFVLYVTNLNYSTTRDKLQEFFEVAGDVKSVRIPKVRKNAFAFVEMSDLGGFKVCNYTHDFFKKMWLKSITLNYD